VVPGVPGGTGLARQGAKQVVKHGDKVAEAARTGNKAADAASDAKKVGEGVAELSASQKTGNNVVESARDIRKARDKSVNPNPPEALPTDRPVGKSPSQNAAKDADVERMQAEGYEDIRVNQQQVNAQGERVGVNRPDLQGTNPATGRREYVEYDRTSSNRGPEHERRIRANDPEGDIEQKTVD
jgi:hypothetical protein